MAFLLPRVGNGPSVEFVNPWYSTRGLVHATFPLTFPYPRTIEPPMTVRYPFSTFPLFPSDRIPATLSPLPFLSLGLR